jgi:hypothetical protein
MEECPICYSAPATVTTRCGHKFCFGCVKQWLAKSAEETKPTCPMCRTTIHFKGLQKIAQSLEEERYDDQCSDLFDEFIHLTFSEMQHWIKLLPDFKSFAQLKALNYLKSVEDTMRVLKTDYVYPETIGEMLDDNAYFNYKTELKRDRRSHWQQRDKFAAKHERKSVMKSGR